MTTTSADERDAPVQSWPAQNSPEQGIVTRLTAFLTARLDGAELSIVDLGRVGVGRSRDNWVFDLLRPGHDRESLILRCDPDGGLVETDRATEFAVLRALENSSLPTPAVRWLDAQGEWLGRPSLIMRREPGACEYGLVNGDRPLGERVRLAREFCDLLAQVHAVDWSGLGLEQVLADPGPQAGRVELAHWELILHKDQVESHPELEFAIMRLRESAPRSGRTVLVHADYKAGNILLDGDRVVALLDWELAHLGDPLEDLGWVTQPLRVREHQIAGSWEAPDLIRRYEQRTGEQVDPVALAWWVSFSTFKTAVMQVSGLASFLAGRSDEPYRPTRRVLSTLLTAIRQD